MTSDSASVFIGRDREIEWLKTAWTQARSGTAQVCVLRGESGFGKTRIVQAFYSWLSSDIKQDPQGYWPDVLLKDGNNLRLNPPPASFGETRSLPWLWWGVRWRDPGDHNLSELSTSAMIDGLHQLEPHREALLARREKLKRTGKVAAELGTVAGELLSFGFLGAGKSLVELIQFWREDRHIQEQEELNVEERQASALQAQMDGLYEFFRFVLEPSFGNSDSLPLILVLDDAHWMDNRSLELIERLLEAARLRRWPLMIIVTHWEQDWNTLVQDAEHASFPALYARLASDSTQSDESSLSMDLYNIDRLHGLEQLLYEGLPGLTEKQIAFVCSRADGNPRLMNEIILELRGEPIYFEQEDIEGPLSEEAVAQLSQMNFALHEVQKRRFRRLDEALRKILSYASYQGMRFLPQLVLDVAQILDAEHATGDDADQLSKAVHPYAVVAAESAVIYEFRHRVFHDLAKERIELLPQLGSSISKALLQVAVQWIEQKQLTSLSSTDQEVFFRLMLEQQELTTATFPNLALQLLAGLFRIYRDTGYLAKAQEWADRAIRELPADGRISTNILAPANQRAIAHVMRELGHHESGKILAHGLVETCRAELNQSNVSSDQLNDVVAAECDLGDIYFDADQPVEARKLYEKALATLQRIVTEFGETAILLHNISVSQTKIGDVLLRIDQPEKAKERFERALATDERNVREFGSTADQLRDITVTQLRIGDVLRLLDQPTQALKHYENALATCNRIITEFGETAERLGDEASSQERVGNMFLFSDQPTQAREFYEKALAINERILNEFGVSARRLLDIATLQSKIAEVLVITDKQMQAREIFEKSLATCERIVIDFGESAKHLEAVATMQQKVGTSLLSADQPMQAREIFEKSLATYERIISDYGETAARLNDVATGKIVLGGVLLLDGHTERVQALYEKSLSIRERIVNEFGESAERLSLLSVAQMAVGDMMLHAGQSTPAQKLFEESLAICERIVAEFGATAYRLRNISLSQLKLGDAFIKTDHPAEAADLYEKSLAMIERIVHEFGETSERLRDVTVAQMRVGDAHLKTDQPKKALELYEKSLVTLERILTEFGETANRMRDVAVCLIKLSNVAEKTGNPGLAREHLAASESLLARHAVSLKTASSQSDLDYVRTLITDVEWKSNPITGTISKDLIVGNWEATAGETIANVKMLESGQFSGTLYTNGILVWSYSGSWSLRDNYLTWLYQESTPPLEEMAIVNPDVNQVVFADEHKFVVIEDNGSTSTYKKTGESEKMGQIYL